MKNNKQLIYKDDARREVLKSKPSIVYCIDNIKPVDAVPVIHARWESTSYVGVSRCSHCNKPSSTPDCLDVYFDYCPHCGAKMDLEVR